MPNLWEIRLTAKSARYEVGAPVCIEVFSSRSTACLDQIRVVHDEAATYPNVYVLVLTADSAATVSAIQKEYVLARALNFALDPDMTALRSFEARGPMAAPHSLLFDCNGTLIWSGFPSDPAKRTHLVRLNSVPVPTATIGSATFCGPEWARGRAAP